MEACLQADAARVHQVSGWDGASYARQTIGCTKLVQVLSQITIRHVQDCIIISSPPSKLITHFQVILGKRGNPHKTMSHCTENDVASTIRKKNRQPPLDRSNKRLPCVWRKKCCMNKMRMFAHCHLSPRMRTVIVRMRTVIVGRKWPPLQSTKISKRVHKRQYFVQMIGDA